MAIRLSTGLRNALMGASGFNSLFDSGTLEIRSGAQPASADDADAGTLLASIPIPADSFGAPASGAIAKAGTWEDTSANATGTAGHFRFKASGGGGGASTTEVRLDGSITATGGGGDMTLDNTSIAAAQAVSIASLTVTMPAS